MVRLVRFAVVAFFLVSSSLASAIDIELGPSDFSRIGSGAAVDTPSGVRHSYGQTVRFPGGRIPDFHVNRNQLIPRGGVVSGLKDLVRLNPASVAATAALTGLFAGIDWVMTDGVLLRNSYEPVAYQSGYYGWCLTNNPGCGSKVVVLATPELACAQYDGIYGDGNPAVLTMVSSTQGSCYAAPISGGGSITIGVRRTGSSCPAGSSYSSDYRGCVGAVTVPVSEADWVSFDSYFSNQPASAVASTTGILIAAGIDPADMSISDDVIDGPVTVVGDTSTSTTTGPDGSTVTNETTSFDMSYGPTSVTNTGSTTNIDTYVNGNLTTSTTTNTTNNSGTTTNNQYNSGGAWIPTDCDFMPTVCQFLEWFKTPTAMPDPEFPEVGEFEDTSGDFNVDFGGSCPQPYLIELALFPPVSFSWQPLCSFAGYMQPMVIISALIFAAYITLGISRGNS